jgi:hypothetical protein
VTSSRRTARPRSSTRPGDRRTAVPAGPDLEGEVRPRSCDLRETGDGVSSSATAAMEIKARGPSHRRGGRRSSSGSLRCPRVRRSGDLLSTRPARWSSRGRNRRDAAWAFVKFLASPQPSR